MTEPDAAQTSPRLSHTVTGWIQILAVVGVLFAAILVNRLLLASEGDAPPISTTAAPTAVAVMTPTPTTDTIRITETGAVRTRANVAITPQVSGRVIEVAAGFAAGGAFDAAEVVFVIDPTDFELAVRQAAADVQSAQSALQLEEAEAETARREWRLVNGDDPIPSLVARDPQIAQARAAVASAQARLADVTTDLERTRYSLPFSGRVLRTTIEVGQTVTANQSYGDVYNLSALEAFISIPAEGLAALDPAVGRPAIVAGAGPNGAARSAARVSRVDAELDTQTRLAGVALTFDEPHHFLPGAFVRVEITGDRVEDVFRLPADAVAAGGRVWVVEDGVLAARQPSLVSRQGGAVLVTRFDAADGVVTTLPPGARDGLPVRVVGSETAPVGGLAAPGE